MTHTYALLEVSSEAYKEVKGLLLMAGYDHAINEKGEIDMHGIALSTDTFAPDDRPLVIRLEELASDIDKALGDGPVGEILNINCAAPAYVREAMTLIKEAYITTNRAAAVTMGYSSEGTILRDVAQQLAALSTKLQNAGGGLR